jgi:hypothetical protein
VNSVCLGFSTTLGVSDDLFRIARELTVQGCALFSNSQRSLVLYRFGAPVAPILAAVYRAVRHSQVGASAVMAVRVQEGEQRRPSDKSVQFGLELAGEAAPGEVVLSVRLAALLEATEASCRRFLHPAMTTTASGTQRAVVRFSTRGGAGRPATHSPIAGRLSPERTQLLADRLSARLGAFMSPTVTETMSARLGQGESTEQLLAWLWDHVPLHLHHFVRRIIDEEFRTIHVRSAPGAMEKRLEQTRSTARSGARLRR